VAFREERTILGKSGLATDLGVVAGVATSFQLVDKSSLANPLKDHAQIPDL
jgi:hypothetical protein